MCRIFTFIDIYSTDISGPCELSQRQEILKDTVTLKWCTTPKASNNIGNAYRFGCYCDILLLSVQAFNSV